MALKDKKVKVVEYLVTNRANAEEYKNKKLPQNIKQILSNS